MRCQRSRVFRDLNEQSAAEERKVSGEEEEVLKGDAARERVLIPLNAGD